MKPERRGLSRGPVAAVFFMIAVLGACGGSGDVAASCDSDDDCDSGTCYTESDPGYCTQPCATEGSTGECLEGTVCKRIEGTVTRCILICENDAECGTNADCNSVPDSELMGCEPVH